MGLTRSRDLGSAVLVAALLGYLLVRTLYRYWPPITVWTGLSLMGLAVVQTVWAVVVRGRIREGRIGIGAGRLHPLAVARSVAVAMASAWVGAVMLGWWLGVLVFLLSRRTELQVAAADTPGAAVAAASALALIAAAVWLQHCCRSPDETSADRENISD